MKFPRRICSLILPILTIAAADVGLAQQAPGGASSKNPAADVSTLAKEAITREESGDLTGAIEINQKILQIEPKNISATNTIAGLYGKLGKFEDEIVWAQKALAINANFALGYINYGNALGSLGKVDEAVKAFEKAAQLDPKDPLAVYSLGVLAEQQDKFQEALGYYQKSIQLDPKFEDGYFNLAATYASLRRFNEAIATLKKLLELNPTDGEAKSMLEDLERQKRQ